MYKRIGNTSGVSLIEAIIGLGILVAVLVGLVAAFQIFFKASLINTEKIQSSFLLEEGVEIVRFLRDTSWGAHIGSASVNTPYYPTFSGGAWSLSTLSTTTLSFSRQVVFHDVFRKDSDSTIIASTSPNAKTLDPNTKLVTITVISPRGNEMELLTYMTNLFVN
jgi:hypothetical protein